jgi:hypothetical protein
VGFLGYCLHAIRSNILHFRPQIDDSKKSDFLNSKSTAFAIYDIGFRSFGVSVSDKLGFGPYPKSAPKPLSGAARDFFFFFKTKVLIYEWIRAALIYQRNTLLLPCFATLY